MSPCAPGSTWLDPGVDVKDADLHNGDRLVVRQHPVGGASDKLIVVVEAADDSHQPQAFRIAPEQPLCQLIHAYAVRYRLPWTSDFLKSRKWATLSGDEVNLSLTSAQNGLKHGDSIRWSSQIIAALHLRWS